MAISHIDPREAVHHHICDIRKFCTNGYYKASVRSIYQHACCSQKMQQLYPVCNGRIKNKL